MAATIPAEVESLVSDEQLVAHLATCRDGRPHVAPVWYRYDDGDIEIMTTGQKLANLRANPRVALSIQHDESGHPEWLVVFRGRAHVVEDEDQSRAQNRRLNRKYGADPDDWAENTAVRIEVASVSYDTY